MGGGSIFESIMMLCFGSSWIFAIARSWRSHSTGGKSSTFLWVILAGYLSGVCHKVIYSFDRVIWLYAVNSAMVIVDIALYYRNLREERARAARPAAA